MSELAPASQERPAVGLLDQYPSRLLAAMAAQRQDWPAAEDFLAPPRRVLGQVQTARWQPALRLFFMAMTLTGLFSTVGALLQIVQDGSIDLNGLFTVASAAFVAGAALAQVRGLSRSTPIGRWMARRRIQTAAAPTGPSLLLNQTEPLAISGSSPTARRYRLAVGAARRTGARLLPFTVLVVGGLGLLAGLGTLLYAVSVAGVLEVGVVSGALFFGLSVLGYAQFGRVLSRSGWRGSPIQLARRAYYDLTRLYSGANLLVQVGVTGAATAAVAAAGLAPVAFPRAPDAVLFGYDAGRSAFYKVEPGSGHLVPLPLERPGASVAALAAVPKSARLPDGGTLRGGSVVAVVTEGQSSRVIRIDARRRTPATIIRLDRRIEPVGLGLEASGGLLLLEHNGALSRADVRTGVITRQGTSGTNVDAASFDPRAGKFLAVAGSRLFTIDVASLATADLGPVEALRTAQPCGVAHVGKGIVVADRRTSTLIAIDAKTLEAKGTIGPSPLGADVCGLVVVK